MMRGITKIRNVQSEQGYVLLTLLLTISLLVIAATVVAPKIAFTIKRDREQEMIHRGVQYTRAIRAFSRKFGRFPNSIEELQNTNGQRFLRKRYKDPITGKDFKLLHLTDVQLSGGPGVAALTQGSLNSLQGQGQQNGAPGQIAAGMAAAGAAAVVVNAASGQAQTSPQDPNTDANSTVPDGSQTPVSKPEALGPVTAAGNSLGTANFGGGAIVGVASASKQRSIREFGHKNHYNDWQFYYDPGFDRGFAITGPTVKMALPTATLRPGETPDTGEAKPANPEQQ